MRKPSMWLLGIGLFLLVAAALMTLFEWTALDERYHRKLHDEQGAARATGLTQEGARRASGALLRFLRGENVDLTYTDSVYGVDARVYGDDEIRHMDDVLGLFTAGRTIRLWTAALGLLLTLAGLLLVRSARPFFRALLGASCAWAALLALFALWAATDFDRAFVLFHQALFANELWMMDESQLMIRLLPGEFFMALAARIAWVLAAGLAALIATGALGALRSRGALRGKGRA